MSRPAPASRNREQVPSSVALLIAGTAAAASALIVGTAPETLHQIASHPQDFAALLLLTLGLQIFGVEVVGAGGGRIGVSAIGILSTGFVLGIGPAVTVAIAAALAQWVVARGFLHRAVFDVSNFALSSGAAASVVAASRLIGGEVATVAGAIGAGLMYSIVNNTLLCNAIGKTVNKRPRDVWNERFRWAGWHYVAFGPLALACATAYDKIGIAGLAAFAFPPALVLVSVRQYIERTRTVNEELQRTNAALERTLENINDLYEFSRGLAAQPHERDAVVGYVEQTLSGLLGARARVTGSTLNVEDVGLDEERWESLSPAVHLLLGTALENAELAETVHKTHLATIAALSRSMEAKDYYTGGHTERVAQISMALAERLGLAGPDLDAIQIGALLHDVGKIGVPERILNKSGPLDEDEWTIMKQHPVISDTILSEVELPTIVRQIARSSHERIDGDGYPDGLAGDEIPLAARIVLVADAWDALTSDRPYRPARSPLEALQEIRAHTATQFCPTVVAALEEIYLDAPGVLGGGRLRVVEVA